MTYEEHQDTVQRENCKRGLHVEDIEEEVDSFGHPVRVVHQCSECEAILEVVPEEWNPCLRTWS